MSIHQRCIPDAFYASIFEIPYDKLKEQGIRTLFFDLDNTIIDYEEVELPKAQIELIETLKKDFKIIILSNTNYKRVSKAVSILDVPFIWHAKKPLKFGFAKALKMANGKKEETIIIGDQLMTDVLGASFFGIKAILVASVRRKSDGLSTRFNRKIEKVILRRIRKKAPKLYQERLEEYVKTN